MIRPITDTLRLLDGGVFLDTASDQLADLVTAVDRTGKSGRLDLSITVKKASRGGAMLLVGKTKLAKPDDAPMETILFATPEGNLLVDDPHQRSLDLKSVPTDCRQPISLKG
jgi:hypothetical protein